jgi:pyruvate carboxylase
MIQSIMIANRGEIAIRIARAAAELGIRAVGAYSTDDALSLHVRRMDAARALPGSGAPAYLDISAMIAAVRESGCDAVHPGYGFLSENAAFARACVEAGLVFVGPAPDAVDLFGDKTAARALARSCDVPVAAGTSRAISLREAGEFLARHGAMMLKAVAGGGGRGMRVVTAQSELAEAYQRCQSEALSSYGIGDVYAEALIRDARHIEVQIVGDGTGAVSASAACNAAIKDFRNCPSPSLSPDLRARIVTAVRMVERVKYRALGTFEFLGGGNEFVFIEANPRLQVEHTVTEEVYGIDLVKAQKRICGGATLAELGLLQSDIPPPRGHAIQLRVNVETMAPDGATIPTGGVISVYEPPSGPGIRVDGFGYAGYRTSASFDSLLAKLIVHAPSRDYADTIARARLPVAEFRIEGVVTNLPFLAALLRHPEVIANRVSTRFVDDNAADLVNARAAADRFFTGADIGLPRVAATDSHGPDEPPPSRRRCRDWSSLSRSPRARWSTPNSRSPCWKP